MKLRKKKKKLEAVPKAWMPPKQKKKIRRTKSGKEVLIVTETTKIRIWGLRTAKRIMAFALMVFSVLFAIGSLATGQFTNVIVAFFLFNTFILLDYLWRTRKKSELDIE